MRFALLSILASFVANAIAQASGANPFNIPNGGYQLTAGKATTVTWKPTTQGTVTLTLRSGASSDLGQGVVLASSIPNSGSYSITPPSDTVRNSDYTIEISSDSDPSQTNFTPQLVVESTNTVESMSSAASASATGSVSSAASMSASMSASASESASTASAASTKSAMSNSMSTSASSATNSASTSTSATASRSSASAESAPTSGAGVQNHLNVQGGLAAMALGAAILL